MNTTQSNWEAYLAAWYELNPWFHETGHAANCKRVPNWPDTAVCSKCRAADHQIPGGNPEADPVPLVTLTMKRTGVERKYTLDQLYLMFSKHRTSEFEWPLDSRIDAWLATWATCDLPTLRDMKANFHARNPRD